SGMPEQMHILRLQVFSHPASWLLTKIFYRKISLRSALSQQATPVKKQGDLLMLRDTACPEFNRELPHMSQPKKYGTGYRHASAQVFTRWNEQFYDLYSPFKAHTLHKMLTDLM
ncbi:hypothetical protein, partial [uncultured Cyclobacterium sp.]|uniref:hypothetical protein n=1 Tax=uncultured Cyclobacterium sp. TaxID=453820 RepID=UPI0030EF932F